MANVAQASGGFARSKDHDKDKKHHEDHNSDGGADNKTDAMDW